MSFDFDLFIIISIAVSLMSFVVAWRLYAWVKKQPSDNKRIAEVGAMIKDGANTFMKKEYALLAKFAGGLGVLVLVFLPTPIWQGNAGENFLMLLSFASGTVFSAVAGILGIRASTIANIKTAEAAKKGIRPAFMTGFRGGSVMGIAVVGATLLGVSLIMLITHDPTMLLGFSFGASTLALFAKAGGGIYTKTADLSADLVGKVELNIPEDDPRNPAVIADNVGDNVGDVAGMGADLFDSCVASIAAALVLGFSLDSSAGGGSSFSAITLCFAAGGLIASIIGVFVARMGEKGSPTSALNKSTYVTTGLFAVYSIIMTLVCGFDWRIWGASMLGLFVGMLIGIASDYYTNDERKPVRSAAAAAQSGPALTIISGISYGLMSVLAPLIGIGVSALISFKLCEPLVPDEPLLGGMYGIAMAAVGMLSIVCMIISNDAYGPIVDNAKDLAEMGGLGEEVIDIADKLDSAGNTVKAITKGFAIGAAGLTVIALLGAFKSEVNEAIKVINEAAGHTVHELITGFNVMDPMVFFGLLVGAAVPAVFSAMLMLGVDRNAQGMIAEIRRQFEQIPGLREGKEGVSPDYNRCIEISTVGALKELIPAGVVSIVITLVVGFVGGVEAIGGFLTGNIVSGLLLALFMSNAGGLWDNAKKYIEAGNLGGKGSDAHKAGVIGDTVGDPFKDTAGPSINTQVTVVSLISSLASVLFLTMSIF